MEYIPCPLCRSHHHRLLFQRRDHTHLIGDHIFNIVMCRNCDFVYVNPRPDKDEIHDFYPPEFYVVHLTPDELLQETKNRNIQKLTYLENLPVGRLLDIGCQKGEFLFEAKKQGWDVYGVEFSKRPPNLFDLPIFYGDIEDSPFSEGYFDVITLWAVLEHLHDPLSMLHHIRRLLTNNGKAFILIPNFNSLPARLMRQDDVPRHLVMFTPKTFNKMAEQAGLKVNRYRFSNDIFSGSCRGSLNYIYKLIRGEKLSDIVAQNREPGRWIEFASCLRGQPNDLMLKVDRIDIAITPYLDYFLNKLGLGFTMTVDVEPLR